MLQCQTFVSRCRYMALSRAQKIHLHVFPGQAQGCRFPMHLFHAIESKQIAFACFYLACEFSRLQSGLELTRTHKMGKGTTKKE